MLDTQEIWKSVAGWHYYEVSSLGNIRRKDTRHRKSRPITRSLYAMRRIVGGLFELAVIGEQRPHEEAPLILIHNPHNISLLVNCEQIPHKFGHHYICPAGRA